YGNDGAGISIGECDGVTVKNNLVFGNSSRWGTGPQITAWSSSHITSDYNLLSPPDSGLPEGPHSITIADDAVWRSHNGGLVIGLARRDLHLAPSSPAIDKGADLSATGITCDIDGTPRPQGKGWDIGAYEWKSAAR
ncbi:MAG: choice-of-anchor Q domain-containing protein, partial [Armatimonadota bacterium]